MTATQQYSGSGDGIGGFEGAADACFSNPRHSEYQTNAAAGLPVQAPTRRHARGMTDMVDKLDQLFGFQEKALQLRSQRHQILASNIANADTPNFKAQELDFKAVLKELEVDRISATHDKHYGGLMDMPDDGMRFRVPFNSSFDGNTVETSVEQANYGRAAADYQATLSFLENRVSSIRKALKGD